MKFSISDFSIATVGTVAIAVLSFLYYKDITTRVQTGNNEVVGTITYKRKTAERKYTGQVIWEGVDREMPVYNFDSIRTSDESEATVRLKDDTEIKLNENSMILISFSKNKIELEFNKGSISASRSGKGEGGLKELSIKSGNTKVTIDKSDVKLSQNKAGDLNLSVFKGKAAVETEKGIADVGTDQAVIVDKDTQDVTKSVTGIKLIDPAPDTYQVSATGMKRIDFSWQGVKEKSRVYFELSNDDFSNIIQKKEIKGNTYSTQLAKGIYYWRIRAENRISKSEDFSESRRLTVLWDEPVILLSPEDKEIITYKNIVPIINFKWTKSEIALGYKLVIASDPAMNSVINTVDVQENYFVSDSLVKGIYHWRIEKAAGPGIQAAASAVNTFEIQERQNILPPELLSPENGKMISKTVFLKGQKVPFTWTNSPEIREFNLVIAKDEKVENPVFQGSSKVNFIQFDKDIPNGRYYWQVTGKLDGNVSTPPSSVWTFSVVESEEIKLISPVNNAAIFPEEDEKSASVRFSWKPSEFKDKYKFVISKKEDFSSIHKEAVLETGTSITEQLDPGKYFWKVYLANEPNTKSSIRSFRVENNLDTPVVISPKDGFVINMGKKNNLFFNWKGVKDANLYRLTLYEIKKGKEYRIADFENTGTSFTITDLRRLSESSFYWTLQAFEVSGKKDIIRKSPLIKNNFKITLGKPVDKVDVNSLKIETL